MPFFWWEWGIGRLEGEIGLKMSKKQTKSQTTEENPTTIWPVVEKKSYIYLRGNFPIIVIISACSWPWEHFQRNQYSGKPFVFQKGCYSKAINIKTLKLSNFRDGGMEEGNLRVCVSACRREYHRLG